MAGALRAAEPGPPDGNMIAHPTRAAGLARLAEFAPHMGRDYAAHRNSDGGPGNRCVSGLSPHLRHRLLDEAELVRTALDQHGPVRAEKFIQEVFWRSYWKGSLELRPQMWAEYRAAVAATRDNVGLRQAMEGRTGIECFDAWVAELTATGWLHNHTRMWFASIWIFTLRLPWHMGAEFFLHHLADADAASNTLSWRWVAGIQTPGKHYLARADNIARYTEGRFDPRGDLNEAAEPIDAPPPPNAGPLPPADTIPTGPVALLLHEQDLGFFPEGAQVARVAALAPANDRSIWGVGDVARDFTHGAVMDALGRAGGTPRLVAPDEISDWAAGLPTITPWVPVGWTADRLRGVALRRVRRPWDTACWPLARRGFFPFRENIPRLIAELLP